jgi:hypothetical protein
LIFKLKEFAADKEKLKIVQPACRLACRQAGRSEKIASPTSTRLQEGDKTRRQGFTNRF